MNKDEHSILASYAVYQKLYETDSTSPYKVLSYFLQYIIDRHKLNAFTVSEISILLKNEFDFQLPDAVISTTLRGIKELKRENKQYSLIEEIMYPRDLTTQLNQAQVRNRRLLNGLFEYIENKNQITLNETQKSELELAFQGYILDRQVADQSIRQSISEYILHISTNNELKMHMDFIRAGSVLYTGLTYGVESVARKGTELTLFLATEVLFDLIGYNGDVFQSLAMDMYKLVQEYNQGGMYIKLKFFSITKQEIDDFFSSAEQVVLHPHLMEQNVAMRSIVRGCSSKADVVVKKADFFHKLQYNYSITEDDYVDYYEERLNKYNLESMEMEKESKTRDIAVISHINKRRYGKKSQDYLRCGYLFITETSNILNISREYSKKFEDVQYAVNMSSITNLLWYKLNKGFAYNSRPANIDTVVKARIILSKIISDGVFELYEKSKTEFFQGTLSMDALAARIAALKEKKILPEDITINNLEDNLNFTEEYIDRYREDYNKQAEIIEELRKSVDYMKTERDVLEQERDERNLFIEAKEMELQKVTKELQEYKYIEERKKKQNEKRIYFLKVFVACAIVFLLLFVFLYWLNLRIPVPCFNILSTAFSIFTVIIPALLTHFKQSKNRNIKDD